MYTCVHVCVQLMSLSGPPVTVGSFDLRLKWKCMTGRANSVKSFVLRWKCAHTLWTVTSVSTLVPTNTSESACAFVLVSWGMHTQRQQLLQVPTRILCLLKSGIHHCTSFLLSLSSVLHVDVCLLEDDVGGAKKRRLLAKAQTLTHTHTLSLSANPIGRKC